MPYNDYLGRGRLHWFIDQHPLQRGCAPHAPGPDQQGFEPLTIRLKDDRGSSIAELAVLLPGIALMLTLALGVGVVGMQQIRAQQTAPTAMDTARAGPPPLWN